MSAKVDTKEFARRLKFYAEKQLPKLASEGLAKAAMALAHDALFESPTVPVDEGTLRGSMSVFVENKRIATGADFGFANGTPAGSSGARSASGKISALVGLNTPYAARHHEVPANFQEPGAGNKYLTAKMQAHKDAYIATVAAVIKNGR